MKIIFHRYGSICEPDIIDSFQKIGITVIEESLEITQKHIDPKTRIRLLAESVLTHRAGFVFSINYFPYISDICEKLQVIYICLSVDCPVLELFSASLRNRCNRIFLFDHQQYLLYRGENPSCIFHLPLASNVERWNSITENLTGRDYKSYSCDVSFVGSLYSEKSPLTSLGMQDFYKGYGDALIEAQRKLPGYPLLTEALTPDFIQAVKSADPSFYTLTDSYCNTDAYVTANHYLGMRLSELTRIQTLIEIASVCNPHLYTRSNTALLRDVICHPGVRTHDEMPKIFHCSKINLNITMYSIQSGLSQRIWDILGCGGFVLSNYQKEIPDLLEIGRDLDCYENISELKEKIVYYLAHDDLRREIAVNGFQKVLKYHTWQQRITEMLRMLSKTI